MDGYGFEEAAPQWHPTPPADEVEAFNRLRLIRSRRVGPTTFRRLLAEHGTAAAALTALPGVAAAAGVKEYEPCPEGVVRAELKTGAMAGAKLIHIGTPEYPSLLSELKEAPPVLWALGDTKHMAIPLVAIVGARNASSLGQRMARKLAGDLERAGYGIVSGLARGIDAAAHTASLESGTVAVQAGGDRRDLPPRKR